MSIVYVLLAHGFEEIEALAVIDILRRGEVNVMSVSIEETNWVLGSHNIRVEADILFSELQLNECSMIVLPGGSIGTQRLYDYPGIHELLRKVSLNVSIAAICAAPSILARDGYLSGISATSHPSYEKVMIDQGVDYSYEAVVVSGRFVTSRGAGTALDFGLALLACLKDEAAAQAVREAIVLDMKV